MQDTPGVSPAGAHPPPPQNAFLAFVQRPRIMLVLLGVWSITGFLSEVFTNSGFFLENHNPGDLKMDGALGGLALGWEGIPLAVLYFYCFRDPVQYHSVFWLALVHQGALFVANIYHWLISGEFTLESVVIPLGVSAALSVLVFVHLFNPPEPDTEHMAAAPD